MKIGVDLSMTKREPTGVGRYAKNMITALKKVDKVNDYFFFFPKRYFFSKKIWQYFWLNFELPLAIKKAQLDLFWQPHHYLPLFFLPKIKYVVSVHDVIPFLMKEYRAFLPRVILNSMLPPSLKKANAIITVSQSSKRDILKVFDDVDERKIFVIYEAADEKFKKRELNEKEKEKLRKKYHLPKGKFVMYLSGIEKRKNIQGIIKIADLLKKEKEIKFCLFGKVYFKGKEYLKEISKRENISYHGSVDEKDLPYLYNLAYLFLFPSFYEGFGLPVLEAMQSGVPVLSSNTSSLPEVVGKGGIMHHPQDYKSFAKDIKRLYEDEKFYQEMQKKAIIQAKNFSWEKSAKELLLVFEKIFL